MLGASGNFSHIDGISFTTAFRILLSLLPSVSRATFARLIAEVSHSVSCLRKQLVKFDIRCRSNSLRFFSSYLLAFLTAYRYLKRFIDLFLFRVIIHVPLRSMLPLCAVENAPIDVAWLLQCCAVKVAGGCAAGMRGGSERAKENLRNSLCHHDEMSSKGQMANERMSKRRKREYECDE